MDILIAQGGVVTNVAVVADDHDLQDGEYRAADYPGAGKGHPVIDGAPTPRPSADHHLVDGAWILDLPLRRARLLASADGMRDALLAAGFAYDFGDGLGSRTLDTRNVEDLVNWHGVQATARSFVSDGVPATEMDLIDADNAVFAVSAETVLAALGALTVWRSEIALAARAKKDAIEAAGTEDALAAIDLETGWPT